MAQLEYNWSELAEDLSKYTEGNVFVLMDTCYSGRLIDVVKERSDANRFTVITATTADLEAAAGPLLPFYYKNQYYHYLSYYCAEGIGYFDGKVRAENGKGIVTAGSLLDYVKPRVAQKTKEDEKKGAIQQTVQFFGNRNLELFQFTSYTNIPRPYSLQVAARTTDALKLKWGKVSDATGYILYQYNASTKEYTKLAITQSNAYTVKDLQPGTTYRFAVRAYRIKYDKTYYSVYSKALVTATKPVAPTVTVKANNGKPIVSWNKVNGATGYEVYYSTKKNGTYQFLISTTKNKVQAIDSIPKGTYYVKVRAYKKISNEVIYSNYSTAKKAIVK